MAEIEQATQAVQLNWAVIIAAIISLIASFITGVFSFRIHRNSTKISEALSVIQAKTSDKQRIVGNVGAQRVQWLNKVRDGFIEYNSCADTLMVIHIKDWNKDKRDEIYNHVLEAQKLTHTVELLLNPKEPYTMFLLENMDKMNSLLIKKRYDYEQFRKLSNYIILTQNVILKAEWKRVKDETERGEFLSEKEVEKIFEEIGKKMNKETHNLVMGKFRDLD